MSNETKRDVFEYYLDMIKGIKDPLAAECVREARKRYSAALPGDLPVIPEAWGDTIEEFKANHYRLSEIFTEWDWNYDEQELIARAWLLGVWRVEETGEIVKLEAEK